MSKTPHRAGWHQHDDDPWGVTRWFDGRQWTERTTGAPRGDDPRVAVPVVPRTAFEIAAQAYAESCATVIDATELCTRAAGGAVTSARGGGADPSYHPIAVQRFAEATDEDRASYARSFVRSYKEFLDHCAAARAAAAELVETDLIGDSDSVTREGFLVITLSDRAWSHVVRAKHILDADWGPTPRRFLDTLGRVNDAIEADIFVFGEDGYQPHIYREPMPTERTCPWCAETIKIAARVCRYCTRDVEPV